MKSTSTKYLLALTVILLVPLLSACGGPAAVDVSLTTYNMGLSVDTVKAGAVVFTIKNDAPDILHEMLIAKTELTADKLPLTSENKPDEEKLTIVGKLEDIPAGKGGTVQLNMDPGHYVIFCNIQNHFMMGMHKEFTVTP
jgi:uncharacterized cupredoxin-like copper-binding protein